MPLPTLKYCVFVSFIIQLWHNIWAHKFNSSFSKKKMKSPCGVEVTFSTFWGVAAVKNKSKAVTDYYYKVQPFSLSSPLSLTLPPSLFHLFSPHFSDPLNPHLTSHLSTTFPHLSSSPLHSELPSHISLLPVCLLLISPPCLPPCLSIFPSSLISLGNNSTAVHTWVVIAELNMGDLEDKWTIRVEELKTSPWFHYRADWICRLPSESPSVHPFSLFPLVLNISMPFLGTGVCLNAKYALSAEVAEWGPPGDILSLHTVCSPIRELQTHSLCHWRRTRLWISTENRMKTQKFKFYETFHDIYSCEYHS